MGTSERMERRAAGEHDGTGPRGKKMGSSEPIGSRASFNFA